MSEETEIKKRSRSHTRKHSHSRSRSVSTSGLRSRHKDRKSKDKSKDKKKSKSKHRKEKQEQNAEEQDPNSPFPLDEGLLTMQATSETDLITALNLISDSVAQQRQKTSSAILHHYLFPLSMLSVASFIYNRIYQDPEDIILVLTFWFMALLMSLKLVGYLTAGYIPEAERVGRWSWLFGMEWVKRFEEDFVPHPSGEGNGDTGPGLPIVDARFQEWIQFQDFWIRAPGGDALIADKWVQERCTAYKKKIGSLPRSDPKNATETVCVASGWKRDVIFVTRFKGKIIATIVLRIVPVDMDVVTHLQRFGLTNESTYFDAVPIFNTARMKAVIRAWTVMQMYREHGIGKEILEFAIEWVREHGFGGPEFASDHVNSLRIVWDFFYRDVERMERRAKDMLIRERERIEARANEIQERQREVFGTEMKVEAVFGTEDVKVSQE
ncbi:hypothetical protein N7456_001109 [Penicillium angulare]|uniref:N-acetyltransferase domain-containing protein n=1 Tax=Penicillium angulare TaxID=116970 RepID=A0A9W9KSZ5_9EURO|nr:hypothetical protein N7456_001109 [Penicillium angulare]